MSDDFEEDVCASALDQQLSLFVNLDGFEGPIDLLLSLAREQKVDLGKISILPLAEQYLLYIETARDLNLEIAADYLVMAAWLAYLKSRLLLPDPEPEQASEFIDMTDALRYQLVRLESMQSAAKRLTDLPLLNRHRLARGQPEEFERKEQIVWQARLYDLLSAYGGMISSDEAEKLTMRRHGFILFRKLQAVCKIYCLVHRAGLSCLPFCQPIFRSHLIGGLLSLLISLLHLN